MAWVTIGNQPATRADYLTIEPPTPPRIAPVAPPCRLRSAGVGWRALTAIAALLAFTAALVACGSDDGGGSGGKTLPDAELADLATGEDADWPEGTPLVINFWASWCTPCRKEMPAFQAVHETFDGRVAIVGVTDDPDVDKAREAAETSGARYPLLVDVDTELLVDFSIAGLPATVFVDEDGTILGRHLGAMTEAELTKEIEERYGIEP